MSYERDQKNLELLKKEYSENTKRIIIFSGAGCSCEVGIPIWNTLADGLFNYLNQVTPSESLVGDFLDIFHDVEDALSRGDFWTFFSLVEKNWNTAYEDYLNEVFSHEKLSQIEVPVVYETLWRMKYINQIFTLNIDGLASRAYEKHNGTSDFFEYNGFNVLDSKNYLDRNYPMVVNLHGKYDQRSTWVMNGEERENLFSKFHSGNYKAYIRYLFSNYTIIFLGINIIDDSISQFLMELKNDKLLKNHYWITDRKDGVAFRFAQDNSVRIINYMPDIINNEAIHTLSICSILDDIDKYKSSDVGVKLPKLEEKSGNDFPDNSYFLNGLMNCFQSCRSQLNARYEFLKNQYGRNSPQFKSFLKDYDSVLALASLVTESHPFDFVNGYKIISRIHSSSSANVWFASKDCDGIAIKTLTYQAANENVEYDSFMRGVESLYYLTVGEIKVAPRYIFHTNVPLSLGMENINGASLLELLQSQREFMRQNWLTLFKKICEAILQCHNSEASVLHRDIKPGNIIFEDYWTWCDDKDFEKISLKLINFDMSWHKFSSGNTKSIKADEVGYYAPEQRNYKNSELPRTAKTDVFMLGMLLFFLLSEENPPEGGASIEGWSEHILSKTSSSIRNTLISNRIGRMIFHMTQRDMMERPDLKEVLSNIQSILTVQENNWSNVDQDFLVEQIFIVSGFDYDWNEKTMTGKIKTPRQIDFSLRYVPRGQLIHLEFMRQRDDGQDRKNFGGRLNDLISEVKAELTNYGWTVDNIGGGTFSKSLKAEIKIRDIKSEFEKFSSETKIVIEKFMSHLT
ncbi:protein kinase domain-containing protein [Acetobacter orientalis]|uniref:protein kinase domain-containing protein n=1 Tax=Acetobacter orientalis TaxID=146474 RepID=UPI0039EB74C7